MASPQCECGKIPTDGEPFNRAKHCVHCTARNRRGGSRQPIFVQQKQEVIRPLPCIYLGRLLTRARCQCPRKDGRNCDEGHGEVTQSAHCETCDDYIADG